MSVAAKRSFSYACGGVCSFYCAYWQYRRRDGKIAYLDLLNDKLYSESTKCPLRFSENVEYKYQKVFASGILDLGNQIFVYPRQPPKSTAISARHSQVKGAFVYAPLEMNVNETQMQMLNDSESKSNSCLISNENANESEYHSNTIFINRGWITEDMIQGLLLQFIHFICIAICVLCILLQK